MKVKRNASIFMVMLLMIIPISSITNSMVYEDITEQSVNDKDLSSWWWEPLELLSAEFDTNNYFSRIAVDNSNNIHIVTSSDEDILSAGLDRDVFYKKFDYVTKSWSELELVSSDGSSYSENPDIAVDSTGTVHVVWLESADILGSGTDRDICYREKTSSGWGSTELVSIESDSTSTYLAIVADSNGVAHVVWEDFADYTLADGDQDIFYKHRSAAGIWSAARIVTDLSTQSAFSPDIQLDSQENVIIAWNDPSNILGSGVDQDVFYRQLDNDFITWSPLKLISSESAATSSSPCLSKGVDGMIHIVWYDYSDYEGAGTDADIFYKSYDPKLDSWSISEVVSTESTGTAFRTYIDVDGTNSVYVIWEDTTDVGGGGTGNNILFKHLDLNTHTWSSLAILTYDNTVSSFTPSLAVDSLGHVHTIFMDSDTSLLGSGADYDLFYKKFVGTPMQPVLDKINPNPASMGNIPLSWSSVQDATNYSIFRETSQFYSIAGLTAISTTNTTSFSDAVSSTGYYYYAVVATNEYGESLVSNIEFVEVTGIFASFELGELLIFAGIVLGMQLIFFLLTITLINSKIQSTAKPKKGKK
ncbi:MAG: hypothetical protein KGD64_10965 [Candidatus Heimdallarchaeota archaeon]|nr:hypothetical protein [Candidatus Heimdallarchaeota archaeon]